MSFIPDSTSNQVDPRWRFQQYQNSVERTNEGDSEFVSVTVTVSDLDQWKQLNDIITRSVIKSGNRWIVSASLKRSDFEAISAKSFVENLTIATKIGPATK